MRRRRSIRRPIRRRGFRRPLFRRPILGRWRMARWGRWLLFDSITYLFIGSMIWKIREADMHRIEQHTNKKIDSLSESELLKTMDELGIERQQATDDENQELKNSVKDNVADMIRDLKRLHDEGILTDKEFEGGKAKLLGTL